MLAAVETFVVADVVFLTSRARQALWCLVRCAITRSSRTTNPTGSVSQQDPRLVPTYPVRHLETVERRRAGVENRQALVIHLALRVRTPSLAIMYYRQNRGDRSSYLSPFVLRQVRLADLEKGLLEALATAQGDLLDDSSLIERLSATKATAAEIQVVPRLTAGNTSCDIHLPLTRKSGLLRS